VLLEFRNEAGAILLTNNPATLTGAQIQTNLTQGTYYLYVRNSGAGSPFTNPPSGYTSYGSVGRYFISGWITASGTGNPMFQFTGTANNPAWGAASPTNGSYIGGSSVQVQATATNYFHFTGWTGDASGTNNPLALVINTNLAVQANFSENLTTNHPTPHWWLASFGFTNNLENVVNSNGANGMAVWQSYIAGLQPTNPSSQFRLSLRKTANNTNAILQWNTVTGRVYTIWKGTNAFSGYNAVAGAIDLPASVTRFTNGTPSSTPRIYYRIQVKKP
jgi:hypothetical protein